MRQITWRSFATCVGLCGRAGTSSWTICNVAYADQHLIPAETRQVDGIIYRIARWADSRRFFKHISVDDLRMHAPVEYQEQVARFTLPDFQRMLGLFGLDIVDRYGDYQLSPYDSRPRLG